MKKATLFLFVICLSFLSYSQEYLGKTKDINAILENIEAFSGYYMDGEIGKLAACYSEDGKIMPPNRDIISGIEAIEKRWTLPEGVKILHHKAIPEEIRIVKKTAYDYGYYEGKTQKKDGTVEAWTGKYIIVWKKIGKEWKIYLDIWNRRA